MLAGAVRDLANNPLDPTSMSFEYDDTRPTVDLTTVVPYPTNKTRVTYLATFSGQYLSLAIYPLQVAVVV
jgi:hypothetical protein